MSAENNHLISWLNLFWKEESFLKHDLLVDGYFLNEVFREIDPNARKNEKLNGRNLPMDFVKNWEVLITNIRVYYTVVLQQALLIRLPSIITIFHDNNSDKTYAEINKAIFLILGAAVQCERKEYFIEDIITRLSDQSIQHGLMGFIKHITEETETVISYLHLDDLPKVEIINTLKKITEDWEYSFLEDTKTAIDNFDELIRKVTDQQNQIQVLRNVGYDNGMTNINSHLHSSDKSAILELAETKAKLRKLQNELDEKNFIVADLRDDFDIQQEENIKLKETNAKLTLDARKCRLLQDELDTNREIIVNYEIMEKENNKLKDKINELEYYRARCEELREDLSLLSNENYDLMDKLEKEKQENEKITQVELENKKYLSKISNQDKMLSDQLEEIQNLNNEIFVLYEKETKNSLSRKHLEMQLNQSKEEEHDTTDYNKSLSNQISENNQTRVIKLEMENRCLREQLSNQKQTVISLDEVEFNQLKEDKDQLTQQIQDMKEKISRLQDSNRKEIENVLMEKEQRQLIIREKQQLETKIESMKDLEQHRIDEYMKEIENLNKTILMLRQRSEKSHDSRINDLDKDNSRLHTALNEATNKINQLEFELNCETQKVKRLDSALEQSQQDHLKISKDNEELNKQHNSLKYVKNNLEDIRKKYSQLEIENSRLESMVSKYSIQSQSSNQIISHTDEMLHQSLEESQRKTTELTTKIKELDGELLKTKADRDALLRQISLRDKKHKSIVDELETCKSEIDVLNKLEGKLKLSEKNQQELLKEKDHIQSQNLQLEQQLKDQERELRKLKSHNEVQLASIDKYKQQLCDLESKLSRVEVDKADKDEIDSLHKSLTEAKKRQIEIDQKNRELFQQAIEEKRKSDTLREELLSEKLEVENLRAQLQQLQDDLDLLGATVNNDEDPIKSEKVSLLENKLNTTVKETIKIKEDKISSLNTKLTASINRNKELSEKMFEFQQKYESLQQKYEEELQANSLTNQSKSGQKQMQKNELPAYAIYLNELKDRLIQLERQNAELSSDKRNSEQQLAQLKSKLESDHLEQNARIEHVNSKHQQEMEKSVKMQVEISAMRSQLTTLRSENHNLSQQISDTEKHLYTATTDLTASEKLKDKLEIQCDSLQKINDRLSREYEQIKLELQQQKSQTKTVLVDLQSRDREILQLRREAESVKQLREILESEKGGYADGAKILINLRQDNQKMAQDHKDLLMDNTRLQTQNRQLTLDNRQLKQDKIHVDEEIVQLRDANAKLHRHEKQYQLEIVKLKEKIEHLMKENEMLRDENQKLLQQMRSMLSQNHELLTETLQYRDNHYSEENALRDKLNNLQRQKERLEEKIMEQYKAVPAPKKTRGGTNKFMKKAREIFRRRDSKTDIKSEIKSPVDGEMRAQRSKSCVTILEKEDDDEIFNSNHSTDRSASIIYKDLFPDSDQDQNSIDDVDEITDSIHANTYVSTKQLQQRYASCSVGDNNSLMSSLSRPMTADFTSQRPVSIIGQLQPGSMSIYDRDESELRHTSELADWLDRQNQSATPIGNHSSNNTPVKYHASIVTRPRPQSSMDYRSTPRMLPQQPSYSNTSHGNGAVVVTDSTTIVNTKTTKIHGDVSSTGNASSNRPTSITNPIHFGSVAASQHPSPMQDHEVIKRSTSYQQRGSASPSSSRNHSHLPPSPKKLHAPSAPERKASLLPVTDRTEEDLYNNNNNSTPKSNPPPPSKSSPRKLSEPAIIGGCRPSSTNNNLITSSSSMVAPANVPSSASSKAILQRMNNNNNSNVTNIASSKLVKTSNPNIKFVRGSTPNNLPSSKSHQQQQPAPVKLRRPDSAVPHMGAPSGPTRSDSYTRSAVAAVAAMGMLMSSGGSTRVNAAPPVGPPPPTRRESRGGATSTPAVAPHVDSSSTGSSIDTGPSDASSRSQTQNKQKVYYQYGNV